MSTIEKLDSYTYYALDGCWYWLGGLCYGYGVVEIDGGSRRAHRVSFQVHKGVDPKDKFVCHTCDNHACINPDHLFLGTAKDNTQDMVKKKRNKYGETHPFVRLSVRDVLRLRELSTKYSSRFLAKVYGVDKSTIRRAQTSKTWKHI